MGRIFIMGDTHGLASNFTSRVNWYIDNPREDDVIICVGDVGLEYGNQVQGALKKAMKKFPGTIYVMRGNHDNRYWRDHTETIETYIGYIEKPCNGWMFDNDTFPTLLYQKKYPNILYVKDGGGVYTINGYRFLFIPGAYSVDKEYRLAKGLPYEPQEQLTWIEENQILSAIDYCNTPCETALNSLEIDYVISHTAPLGTQIYFKDLFLDFIDQSTVDNHMEHFLDEVYHQLNNKFKHWYFGHYHSNRSFGKFTMIYSEVVEIGE